MALRGPQWENTFWNDEVDEGEPDRVRFSDKSIFWATDKEIRKADKRARKGKPLDRKQERLAASSPQGMLFSPDTGTGLSTDPLVGRDRRVEAVLESFDTDGTHDAIISGALANSGLPIDLITSERYRSKGVRQSMSSLPEGQKLSIANDPDRVSEGANGTYHPSDHSVSMQHYQQSPHYSHTLVHELGHARHMQGEPNRHVHPSPYLEGVADGFADAYDRPETTQTDLELGGGDHSPVWNGPADRKPLPNPSERHSRLVGSSWGDASGYGTSNHRWRNTAARGVYAAARHLTAVTGEVPELVNIHHNIWDENDGTVSERGEALANGLLNQAREGWGDATEVDLEAGDLAALGKLVYDNSEVLNLFQMVGPGHSEHWQDMRNAASRGLRLYKSLVDTPWHDDQYGNEHTERHDRSLPGPEAGWKASRHGVERHNEHVQSMTLPLVDPETGEQYDNRVKYEDRTFPGGHPLPKIEKD